MPLGLSAGYVVSGSRPFLVYAALGDRVAWSVEIDDVSSVQAGLLSALKRREGPVNGQQGRLKVKYANQNIPSSVGKATVSAFHQQHVGDDLDGKTVWVGVSHARCLEIVSLGLALPHRYSSPLLWFLVFADKSA